MAILQELEDLPAWRHYVPAEEQDDEPALLWPWLLVLLGVACIAFFPIAPAEALLGAFELIWAFWRAI